MSDSKVRVNSFVCLPSSLQEISSILLELKKVEKQLQGKKDEFYHVTWDEIHAGWRPVFSAQGI